MIVSEVLSGRQIKGNQLFFEGGKARENRCVLMHKKANVKHSSVTPVLDVCGFKRHDCCPMGELC